MTFWTMQASENCKCWFFGEADCSGAKVSPIWKVNKKKIKPLLRELWSRQWEDNKGKRPYCTTRHPDPSITYTAHKCFFTQGDRWALGPVQGTGLFSKAISEDVSCIPLSALSPKKSYPPHHRYDEGFSQSLSPFPFPASLFFASALGIMSEQHWPYYITLHAPALGILVKCFCSHSREITNTVFT